MQGATDDEVLAHAASEHQVLVTTDTDFRTILACRAQRSPRVLLPVASGDIVNDRASALIRVLTVVEDDLLLRRRG